MSNDQSFKNRKPAMGKTEPGTIKRIFSYIFQYKWRVIAIVVCILVGAAAQAGSALFLQSLIDTYILPMVGESNSDWAPLLRAISLMACLYVAGIVASWLWQWLIVTVEQGTLKKIRDDMFAHQQKLPIRYFDSHEHGDIMSHYTNDTDTLRQAISQSFPQMFSSIISAVAALLSMLWLSIPFTAFVIVFTVLLYFIVRKIVSRSGRYFVKQQQWIGDVNAFVEESVNGQKVIKVFNHEDATQKTFDEKNEELFEASAEANTWGNVTMPVVGNMGYLLYILLAIVGAAVSLAGVNDIGLTGVKPLTLGTLVSLLTLSRSFINPIGQVSQQHLVAAVALARVVADELDHPLARLPDSAAWRVMVAELFLRPDFVLQGTPLEAVGDGRQAATLQTFILQRQPFSVTGGLIHSGNRRHPVVLQPAVHHLQIGVGVGMLCPRIRKEDQVHRDTVLV